MQEFIDEITKYVIKTREYLSKHYDVTKGQYKDYTGLCDKAIQRLFIYLRASGIPREHLNSIHGEQKHSIEIPSSEWFMEHTWGYIIHNGITIYVDPTSQQFKYLYYDIPNYYVSTKPPRWYLPDMNNVVWKPGILHTMNEKIKIGRFGIVDHLVNLKGFAYDNLFHHS